MLEHLISEDLNPVVASTPPSNFVPLDKASPENLIDAQAETANWLENLGLTQESVQDQAATTTARAAFAAITLGTTPGNIQNALTSMKTPAAVQRLVGMLTAYDWEFVQQAKELRGYTVAKLLEETENPNANIRLKALGLLGKVTEVGLFTEKIEVKQAPASDAELDARIKEKLGKFMGVVDVMDISKQEAQDIVLSETPEEGPQG
jgi:HEAT repeat protein